MALMGMGNLQTLLGRACFEDYEDIVEYLISRPDIDLEIGVRNHHPAPPPLQQTHAEHGYMDMILQNSMYVDVTIWHHGSRNDIEYGDHCWAQIGCK